MNSRHTNYDFVRCNPWISKRSIVKDVFPLSQCRFPSNPPILSFAKPSHVTSLLSVGGGGGGENSTPPIKVYPVFRWRCVVPLFVMAHFVLNPFQKAVKELTKEIVDGVGDSLVSEVQWSSVHYTCIQRLPFVLFLLRLFVCSINSVSVGCLTFGMLPSCVAFSDSLNSLIYFRVKFWEHRYLYINLKGLDWN